MKRKTAPSSMEELCQFTCVNALYKVWKSFGDGLGQANLVKITAYCQLVVRQKFAEALQKSTSKVQIPGIKQVKVVITRLSCAKSWTDNW